jgi:hypothetical protein
MVVNWLANRVFPQKKQVHLGWEYSWILDPICEVDHHIPTAKLEHLLKEMFPSIEGWPTPNHVYTYHN